VVDDTNNKLSESLDIERCNQTDNCTDINIPSDLCIASNGQTDNSTLFHFKTKFPAVFDPSLRSKSILHSVRARVETQSDNMVHSKARPLSPEKFLALQTELKRLLDAGVLAPSYSEFSSPIVMVPTKDGTFRLCTDLTQLNKILKTHKYTLPNIKDFTTWHMAVATSPH